MSTREMRIAEISFAEIQQLTTNALPSPEMALQATELREAIEEVLEQLNPRERLILKLRFGLGFQKEATLKEVGDMFKVSGKRISQIELKAIRKLKHPSRSNILKKAGGRVAYMRTERDYLTHEYVEREYLTQLLDFYTYCKV